MTFSEWKSLSPADAARELHHRARTLLTPEQRRAAIAFLKSADELAEEFAHADRSGPLGRVPCFLKDLFDLAGHPTFAGSIFLPKVRPAPLIDSNLVRALEDAGVVVAGKTHLHEFAYGITGENPHYGDCEHPRFPGRTTGGSSSGSAAVVAAGIVPFAIGTDTGGSVRLPAAFCGLYGFRLTPGDDFIKDAVPLAPSFDTAGWFTNNAADMLTVLDTLLAPATASRTPHGLYIELPGLDPDVASALRAATQPLTPHVDALTADELVSGFAHSTDAYNQIVAAEAWRFHTPWAETFCDRYDPAVWQRLQRGANQSRADYEHALIEATSVRLLWTRYFAEHDFLLLPASPFGALTKRDCTLENRNRILALTAPASLGGLPVLTIPVPLPSGLTTGLQLVVPHPHSAAIRWLLHRCREQEERAR